MECIDMLAQIADLLEYVVEYIRVFLMGMR